VCDKHVNAIIDSKSAIDIGALLSWPRFASYDEDLALRDTTKWRHYHYDGPRVILWDMTNIPCPNQNTKMAACSEQHGAHIMARIASRYPTLLFSLLLYITSINIDIDLLNIFRQVKLYISQSKRLAFVSQLLPLLLLVAFQSNLATLDSPSQPCSKVANLYDPNYQSDNESEEQLCVKNRLPASTSLDVLLSPSVY